MMKNKSNVSFLIPQFFATVLTQFDTKIKGSRSDNAPELDFNAFLTEKGVLHQL